MTTKKKPSKKVNTPSEGWPKITIGSHLTVIEHENGKRELKWDDDALMRDVGAATLKAESTIPAVIEVPKKSRKKKIVK